jgi:hypothetical protein
MKRTATTLVLLAGFGGGCVSPDGGAKKDPVGGFGTVTHARETAQYQGPNGEPVLARGAAPGAVVPAAGTSDGSGVSNALFRRYGSPSSSDLRMTAYVPGMPAGGAGCTNCAPPAGPAMPAMPGFMGGGIYPVPGMGPPGAVAANGALVGGQGGSALPNGRASIKFTGPAGMKVTWQLPGGGFNDEATGLTAPKEYNFLQGQTYRLRLTQVLPNHPGKSFYPSLEVGAANPKTVKFLAHSCVPITFTNEDFDQATSGNLVVKVIYLPDRDNQDFVTVGGGIEEVVSTRLEPGADPVAEAQRRGTVLAIVLLGNIDLENRISPPMNAIPGGMMMMPGGPGMIPGGPGMIPGGPMPKGPVGGLPPGTSTVLGGPTAPNPGPAFGAPQPPIKPPALGTLPDMLPPVK